MNLLKLKLNIYCTGLLHFLFIISLIFSTSALYGGIYNGDFELYDPNAGGDFDEPVGWNPVNYAASVTNFVPNLEWPEYGSYENWKIDTEAGLDPYKGNRFVVLSTGEILPRGSTDHGMISQNIQVYAGQTLSGVYFFGTCDYLSSYNDYGSITLQAEPNSLSRNIVLVQIDVGDVGNFGSTDGWQYFEYSFTQEEVGAYELTCLVQDVTDQKVNSYLAIDDLRLCITSDYGDINNDCQTNIMDFGLLGYTWLCDYRDPNNIPDPNSSDYHEVLYGDLDGNNWVNSDDLSLMAEGWLTGE